MKVYVNATPTQGPWGGGNQWLKSFLTSALRRGSLAVNERPDVTVISSLDASGDHLSAEQLVIAGDHNRGKLVLRVNENDARKGTNVVDPRLLALFPRVDGIVFVSQWLRDYFVKAGWDPTSKKHVMIHNGVNHEIFCPSEDKLSLETGTINIVAHHWSDNRLKGADIYESIDEFVGDNPNYTFTYVGRTKSRLPSTNIVPPLPADDLGPVLNKFDVYVSGSRHDPGPNHVIEALACGLPTYVHSEGGGAVEFASASHTFSTWQELWEILLSRRFPPNPVGAMPSWETCMNKYHDFIEEIADSVTE